MSTKKAKKKKEAPPPKKARGTTKMREAGYRRVDVWLDVKEQNAIDRAAARAGKKVATWIRELAMREATHANRLAE